MANDDKKIIDLLVKENYVSSDDASKAQEWAKTNHSSILAYLLEQQLISKDLLGQALAESVHLSYADLNSHQPTREQVLKIPENFARKYRLSLFKEEGDTVYLTTDKLDGTSVPVEVINLFAPKKVLLLYSLTEDIETVFLHYKKTLATRFSDIIKSDQPVAPEIVGQIFEDALTHRASDIHFEPQEEEVVIRFRIDGVLHEAGRVQKNYYENILNRLKVLARLRLDEHMSAQDGVIKYSSTAGGFTDMRTSIVPTVDGEKVVLRLMSQYVRDLTLSDLGLSPADQDLIANVAQKPFGMILVTGPTGSGKTTTLYTLLKMLNKTDVNITTIEDPVEYKILGVNQIQVNNQTNLTFSNGLRSIVRQDPDIILVGEIRDTETAEIAVNAALTGHLLLSTFHANDAATGIPRLLDMGVEPFLLASTMELIVAQRLARRICEACRYSRPFKRPEVSQLAPDLDQSWFNGMNMVYQGKGCNSCNHTGYRGRIGIFEFIRITPEMQNLILHDPSKQEIWALAKKQGARSLFEDGLDKVKNGITTIDELLRVVTPPDTQLYGDRTSKQK